MQTGSQRLPEEATAETPHLPHPGSSPLVTTFLQKEASAWLVFTWEDSTWAKQAVFMSPSDHWGSEEL